jgi:uncharacterized HAD superfamily protein
MNIGIDLDEVLVDTMDSIIKYYNLQSGKNFKKEDFHSFDWWNIWGGTREEAIKFYFDYCKTPFFDSVHPLEGAVEAMKILSANHNLVIITSRPAYIRKKTEKWLQDNFGNFPLKIFYSKDFHSGNGKNKVEICKEFEINLMIEDHEVYAAQCAEAGIPTLLFDKPWNKNAKHPNITRVKNWIEALEQIEHFKNS